MKGISVFIFGWHRNVEASLEQHLPVVMPGYVRLATSTKQPPVMSLLLSLLLGRGL
jgi:hypothetical protein